MTKHFARPQFPPRPTKGALVAAAKKQVAADVEKAKEPLPPVDESKFETKLPDKVVLAVMDKGELSASDVGVVQEVLAAAATGDQQKAAELIIDAVAGSATKPDQTPPAETAPAAASPPTSEEQAKAVNVLITQGTVTTTSTKAARTPKGTDPTGQYVIGKKYVPKTDRNSATWGKITKALADGPKTMKELAEAVKDHSDFLGYMTRGGHIVPYVAKTEATV